MMGSLGNLAEHLAVNKGNKESIGWDMGGKGKGVGIGGGRWIGGHIGAD
jgi:hypothetical protein